MTKARTPAGSGQGTGTGSEQTGGDSTTLKGPVALTFDEIPGLINTMSPGLVQYPITDGTLFSGTCELTSTDWVYQFTAQDNGRIEGIFYKNGTVALDTTAGWEMQFTNQDQTNSTNAYFGFGPGTEAVKGTDAVTVAAAEALIYVSNSLNAPWSRFDKGDVVLCTADRDGTTGVGSWVLLVSYESEGFTTSAS